MKKNIFLTQLGDYFDVYFAAHKGADSRGQNRTCQHDDHDPDGARGAHGVDVGLLCAVTQHGFCPAVGIGEEHEIGPRSAEGDQNVGKGIDLPAFILSRTGNEIGDDAHDEISQCHRPVHTGHEPDNAQYRTEDRGRPALLHFGHHEQIHRPAEQRAAHGHVKCQHRVRGEENAAHEGEYKEKCGEYSHSYKVFYSQALFYGCLIHNRVLICCRQTG